MLQLEVGNLTARGVGREGGDPRSGGGASQLRARPGLLAHDHFAPGSRVRLASWLGRGIGRVSARAAGSV